MNASLLTWVGGLIFYIVASRLAMRCLGGAVREAVMVILNLAAVFYFLMSPAAAHPLAMFAFYVALVCFQYLGFRLFSGTKDSLVWVGFFIPIAALVFIRYVPGEFYLAAGHLIGKNFSGPTHLIGISYLAFRCSRLVLEVRNGNVKPPGLLEYLNFAFFLPTMPVGPINTYANFRLGFASRPWDVPAGRAALRILVGLIKYKYLGGVFGQLTYTAFLLNGHPHLWVDLPVVMVFYYLYLYCNFSGFCDLAIGAAALIGIPVLENFDNPLAARNMKEFWNRWHITLSQWMRDLVFSPLSKYLVRIMGTPLANHAIALTIMMVFLLIGIWHGVGWNYVLFGLAQALGVVTVHYYTIFLKKRLRREGFSAYNQNRWIQAAAVTVTFCYYAVTLFLFANSVAQMKEIFSVLR